MPAGADQAEVAHLFRDMNLVSCPVVDERGRLLGVIMVDDVVDVVVAGAIGDPKRVLAGTDCGFDTSAGMGRVAEDVVWAKLRSLADGARIASKRLFA